MIIDRSGFGRRGTKAIITFAARLLTVSLLVACDDPVRPDDVRRLLGPPVLDEVDLEANADAVLDVPLQGLLRFPSSEIVVEHEGEWSTYRALIIEIVFDPDTGYSDGVSRNRRSLRAWRVDRVHEVFAVGGGHFPAPMGPMWLDGEPESMFGFRPWATMHTADGRLIRHATGEADLQLLRVRESCPWSSEALTRMPRESDTTWRTLVQCAHAEYAVSFQAELARWEGSPWKPVGQRTELRMLTHRVSGIRITIACDKSPSAEELGCGEWKFAPDW